jgi:hypothetical protein
MQTRYFALIAGIVYVLIGLLGFLPGVTQAPPPGAPELALPTGYGFLLGLFAVNVLHNIVHLLIGVFGLVAYRRYVDARLFARVLAVVYGVLTIMGLVPGLDRFFGFIPLFGHDVWLHALTAIIAAYFGFVAPATDDVRRTEATTRA